MAGKPPRRKNSRKVIAHPVESHLVWVCKASVRLISADLASQKNLKFFFSLPIIFLVRGTQKRRENMETQDFLRVINELDFILDDIDEISGQLDLTKTENNKIYRAISGIEKSKKILVELFPNIKSLDYEVREDLTAEFMDS
jgi:hypothetical protein